MKVIGLDPGSRYAGFGVIQLGGPNPLHLEHGVVAIPERLSFGERLAYLARELKTLWQRHPGADTVVEKIFLGKNPDSAFKLGHARGVCLMLAADSGAPIFEYAARQVKKVVTGHGGATKEHVQMVVKQILRVQVDTRADASDALAMALCHAQMLEQQKVLKKFQGAWL